MKKKEIIKALCKSLNDDDLLNFMNSANFIFETLEDDFDITSKDEKELVEAMAEVSVILKGIAARLDIVDKVDAAEDELILEIIATNVGDIANDNDFEDNDFEDDDFNIDEFENFDDFDEFDDFDDLEDEEDDEDGIYESWIDTDDIKDSDSAEKCDKVEDNENNNEEKNVSADDFIAAFEEFNNSEAVD